MRDNSSFVFHVKKLDDDRSSLLYSGANPGASPQFPHELEGAGGTSSNTSLKGRSNKSTDGDDRSGVEKASGGSTEKKATQGKREE
jgi:hypothetical protein